MSLTIIKKLSEQLIELSYKGGTELEFKTLVQKLKENIDQEREKYA
ncbi:MAG: hypothetical protein Q8Q35_02505 [Nanoarchaeota archaeon]|nr:hypothetical protein [Nanoarchaeota archaeon]